MSTDNEKENRVWAYLVANRQASVVDVAEACDVEDEFVQAMMDRIGSENWRENVSPFFEADIPDTDDGIVKTDDVAEGHKFDADKARYDLIPPEIEEAIAQVLTFGASKYGARNWELGMAWGRPYAALRRHMAAWWAGENTDAETGMSHLWHAACCIAFLVAFEARKVGEDDRTHKPQ